MGDCARTRAASWVLLEAGASHASHHAVVRTGLQHEKMLLSLRDNKLLCILSLADVRRASGQRCSRFRAGDLGVLSAVRRPRGQPQAAVLPNSPRPASVPPRCGPEARRVGDFWSSSSRRPFGLAGRPRPRCRSPSVRSALGVPPAPHAASFLSCAGHIHPPLILRNSRRSS